MINHKKLIAMLLLILGGLFWGVGMGWNFHIIMPDQGWITWVTKIPAVALCAYGAVQIKKIG